jgi:hypothetical protein
MLRDAGNLQVRVFISPFERNEWTLFAGKGNGFDGPMLKCKTDFMSVTLPGPWLPPAFRSFSNHMGS